MFAVNIFFSLLYLTCDVVTLWFSRPCGNLALFVAFLILVGVVAIVVFFLYKVRTIYQDIICGAVAIVVYSLHMVRTSY